MQSIGELHTETKQRKQIDQFQQTTMTADFPAMADWKYNSVLPGDNSNAARGVKPFVKEWVESQNQAIAEYFADQVRLAFSL